MEDIKISIIIPVYNVEKYLEQCLDSIVNQTLEDIEIICINDGSTDNSSKILETYKEKDKRIKIIRKKNEGLGAARNTGMEYVKGDYIGFVDSDDWVSHNMFEKLYNNAKKFDSDVVMCPVNVFDENSGEISSDKPYYTLECFDKSFDNRFFNHFEAKDFFFGIAVMAFNKIYKKSFLEKLNVKFPEGLLFEDNPFFYETFLSANRVSLIRDFVYYYRTNRKDSIINKSGEKFFDVVTIHKLTLSIFENKGFFDIYKFNLYYYVLKSMQNRYNQVSENLKQEFFELIQEFVKKRINLNEKERSQIHFESLIQDISESKTFIEFDLKVKNDNEKTIIELEKNKKMKSSNSWKITKLLRKIRNLP